MLGAEVENFTK